MSVDSAGIEQGLLKQLLSKSILEREQAWDFVYRTYFPMVRDFVHRSSGGDNEAADIFQDGLMVLHRNLNNGSFRQEASIKTYIFSICKNLWLKELSRKQKQLLVAEDFIVVSKPDFNYLILAELVTLLLDELKEDCKSILIEHYFNKTPMAELKDMFHVSSSQAARNKKMRCLGYLIKLVKDKGISSALDR